MILLVLERGAPWPQWAHQLRARAPHSMVEQQTEGESERDFSARVEGRVRRLTEQGHPIIAAGYICAPRPEPSPGPRPGHSNRDMCLRICATLLSVLTDAVEEPELVIGCREVDPRSHEREELLQLWTQLSLARRKTTVSVRFDEGVEPSEGVRDGLATPSFAPGPVGPSALRGGAISRGSSAPHLAAVESKRLPRRTLQSP